MPSGDGEAPATPAAEEPASTENEQAVPDDEPEPWPTNGGGTGSGGGTMKTLARLGALPLLVLATAPLAQARALDGVYTGKTADGRAVRFLVWAGGTRVGDFTFGRLPTSCGAFDAFAAQAIRVRRGRFSGSYEIPSGSEFVDASGRLSSRGRARGSVGQRPAAATARTRRRAGRPAASRRSDPVEGSTPDRRWRALEQRGLRDLARRGRRLMKPSLKRIPGRRWTVRLGGGRLAGAVATATNGLLAARQPGCRSPASRGSRRGPGVRRRWQGLRRRRGGWAPAALAGTGGDSLGGRLPSALCGAADGQHARRDPHPGPGRPARRVRSSGGAPYPATCIDGVRLAGAWVAVKAGLRDLRASTSAPPVPPLLDETTVPAGVAYVGRGCVTGGRIRPGIRRQAGRWPAHSRDPDADGASRSIGTRLPEPAAHPLLAPAGGAPGGGRSQVTASPTYGATRA